MSIDICADSKLVQGGLLLIGKLLGYCFCKSMLFKVLCYACIYGLMVDQGLTLHQCGKFDSDCDSV